MAATCLASIGALVACIHEDVRGDARSALPPGKVAVTGEVGAEGLYPFTPGMTLADAVRMAGGITPAAVPARASVTRTAKGIIATVPIHLDRILSGSDPDIPLEEGDVVHIPSPQ